MARTGQLVMHGDRDGEYDMFIDLAGINFPPYKLRTYGYSAQSAILAGLSAASNAQPTSEILPVEVEGNALPGDTHIETLPVLESQSSTASLKEIGDEEVGSRQVPQEETGDFQDPNTQATTMDGSEDDTQGKSPQSQQDPDIQATMDGSKDDDPGTLQQDLDTQPTVDGSKDDVPGMSQQDPDIQPTVDGSKDDVPGMSQQDPDIQPTMDGSEDNIHRRSEHNPDIQPTMDGSEDNIHRRSEHNPDPQATLEGSVPGTLSRTSQGTHKQKKPVRVVGRVPQGLARDDFSEEDEDPISEIDKYSILDNEKKMVSLFELPLLHHENNDIVNVGCSMRDMLHIEGHHCGYAYSRKIRAWKLVFIPDHPVHLQVKIDEFHWAKVRKPAARYKKISESVYFVVKFLDIMKKDPSATAKAAWKLLLERNIDKKTVLEYLKKQTQLIEQYIAFDSILTSANVLETYRALLSMKAVNSQKRTRSDEEDENDVLDQWRAKKKKARMTTGNGKMSKVKETLGMEETRFQHAEGDVSMSETEEEVEEEVDQDDEELGDPLCTICDDGGDLLCCEGPCMRSFHAHTEAGIDSDCKSLGFTKADLEKMEKYLCKNCKYKKHQCYVCGKLGTSDETLGGEREVFVCEVALCGKFYHPHCIAKMIAPSQGDERPLARRIQSGEETFTCPMHTCVKCGKCEDKEDETEELRLAKCRRCPATWHVKCLPKEIAFDDKCESQRAWRVGKRPRFIIYCMKHKLDSKLQTPARDHLLEPSTPERRPEPCTTNILHSQGKKTGQASYPGFSGAQRAKSRVANHNESAQSGVLQKEKSQEENAARENIRVNRRILDVIRISVERKPEEKIKAALLCKVPKSYRDKTFKEKEFISDGKLSSMLKAARNAMQKYQNSNRLEDARMICPPASVTGIINAERMLRTFLAPTLFGNRYTSFGRHFTKDEKLQEVANRLHIHIDDGDMLVDFCCGSNDFSIKMHEILSRNGKQNCRYKNFDILKPKNTFHFEQKDWLTVTKDDLEHCQNLVIGLNPPFADAKKFVLHALYSDPKLLVLIIPEDPGLIKSIGLKYECILDDNQLLAGKAFYLPGSVHRTDTEMLEQGNHIAPHLYLFRKRSKVNKRMPPSRADYSPRHERRHVNASDSIRSHQPAGDVGLDSLFIPNRRNPKINRYENPRFAVPARGSNDINIAPRSSGPPLSQNYHPKVGPRSDPPPHHRGVNPSPLRSSSQSVAATSGCNAPRTSQLQHGVAPNAQFTSSSRHHPSLPTSAWDSTMCAHTVNLSYNSTLPPFGDNHGNNNRGVPHHLPPLPPLPPAHLRLVPHERPSVFPTSSPSYFPPHIPPGMQINRFPNRDPRLHASVAPQFHQVRWQQSSSPPLPSEDYHEGGGWLED